MFSWVLLFVGILMWIAIGLDVRRRRRVSKKHLEELTKWRKEWDETELEERRRLRAPPD